MRVIGSKVAVVFDAPPVKQGGVFISENLQDEMRPQIGTVAACGPNTPIRKGRFVDFPAIGTRVFVVKNDGTQITNPPGVDAYEVRVYGSWAEFQAEPQECDWWLSIPCGFENMSWKAFGNQVLIEPDPKEEKIGEIYIPDIAQRRTAMGTIRSIGPLVDDVQVGDRVCYDPFKCHPLQPAEQQELGGLIPADVLAVEYVVEAVAA